MQTGVRTQTPSHPRAGSCDQTGLRTPQTSLAVVVTTPFWRSSIDPCCVALPPRWSFVSFSYWSSAIGLQTFTGQGDRLGGTARIGDTAFRSAAAVTPPNGPALSE